MENEMSFQSFGHIYEGIDSFGHKKKILKYFDYSLARFVQKTKNSPILFSKYGKTKNFLLQKTFIKRPGFQSLSFRSVDSLSKNFIAASQYRYERREIFDFYREIKNRYFDGKNYLQDWIRGSVQGVSAIRMWNLSIVSALIFGMFLMTFIYRYLGQGASATSQSIASVSEAETEMVTSEVDEGIVLGESVKAVVGDDGEEEKTEESYVTEIISKYQKESNNEETFTDDIKKMTKGYPIEKMAPFIAKQDKIVAAFLIAIAKKESDWGKHVPVLKGKDCYNYWGYRGIREKMGSGGHTCFDSPEDAVRTVAKRLKNLVSEEKVNTPAKMVEVWKCGYDCSWDSPEAVKKWVSDVDHYFKEFNELED